MKCFRCGGDHRESDCPVIAVESQFRRCPHCNGLIAPDGRAVYRVAATPRMDEFPRWPMSREELDNEAAKR